MMPKKWIAFALAFTMLSTLLAGAPTATAAQPTEDSGMVMNKRAEKVDNDTYRITLEAYATGETVINQELKDIPTDIVLVIDQSGSMEQDWGHGMYNFTAYTDKKNSSHYNNGSNLWYKMDGQYVAVTVGREQVHTYSAYPVGTTNEVYDDEYEGNLYALYNGQYYPITVEWEYEGFLYHRYHYSITVNGTNITGTGWRDGNAPDNVSSLGGLPFYRRTSSTNRYTYTYTLDGTTHTLGTSDGDNTQFEPTLYQRSAELNFGTTKLAALQSSLAGFIDSVYAKAVGEDNTPGTADDVNHRIAVVGFAGSDTNASGRAGTEILSVPGSNSGTCGVSYFGAGADTYSQALQSVNTQAGQDMVSTAVSALNHTNGTRIDLGMDMADEIFRYNPLASGETRNRVVVVFTDGEPSEGSGWAGPDIHTNALSHASTIKNTHDATVYTIGVFGGADPTSAGTPAAEPYPIEGVRLVPASNWFLQTLSSGDGVAGSGYYLSSAEPSGLSYIFQQISSQISTGNSEATLTSQAVLRDFIAPAFALPEGAAVSVKTMDCNGMDTNGDYTWNNEVTNPSGVTYEIVDVDGIQQVNVTGFDYKANFVGPVKENGITTGYQGKKLVVSFEVAVVPDFLGGNNVPTNGSNSGIYKNGTDQDPFFTFAVPEVNVPLVKLAITPHTKTIYQGQSISLTDLYEVTVVDENNHWVQGDVQITANGTPVTGDTVSPTDCTEYTITATLTPKESGDGAVGVANPSTGITEDATVTVHVLKPQITAAVQDVEAYYGESYTLGDGAVGENPIAVDWSDTQHTSYPVPAAEKPFEADDLHLAFATDAFTGQTDTLGKADVDVSVKVMRGNEELQDAVITTHCSIPGAGCEATQADNTYTVHIKTCTLTIQKTGGAANEPYVFTVLKGGAPYTQASITGGGSITIKELPVGTYTIQEDAKWSWRFTPTIAGTAELNGTTPNGTLTCTNTQSQNKWLNAFSAVIQNIFQAAH